VVSNDTDDLPLEPGTRHYEGRTECEDLGFLEVEIYMCLSPDKDITPGKK
jgi:hypothetical protein